MTLVALRSRSRSLPVLLLGAGVVTTVGIGVAAMGTISPIVVVAAALALGGAAAILLDPRWGLVAVATFAVLRLPDVATDFHGAPSLFTPLVGLVLLALFLRGRMTGEWPIGGVRALVVTLGFATVALLSLLASPESGEGVRAMRALLEDGTVAVLAGMLVRRSDALRIVAWVLVAGGGFLATLSVIQYTTGAFGSTFGGFAQSAVQNIYLGTDDVRISGPIGDPNFYAQLLVMIIPLAYDRLREEYSRLLQSAAGYVVAVGAITVVLTFSRGGLLALGAVLAVMTVRHPPRPRTLAVAALAIAAALPLVPAGYSQRLTSLGDVGGIEAGIDPSIRGRTAEVAAAWEMFWERPLSGIGYGNFAAVYPDYAEGLGLDVRDASREAHNLYLETAAETGIPGLLALGGIFAAGFLALHDGRRRFRAMADLRSDGIGFAIGVAFVGYLVTSVFLHMAFARPIWLLLGIALAFPSVAAHEDRLRQTAVEEASWR